MAFSNSPLITYQRISPNKSTPRNHSIDTITIHCMAAQWTAKQCCDYFSNSGLKASSNYCVGKDGSIGLSVEEKDRSWCSSSASNDNRAITIEVASDSTHPYKVTESALNSLIDLLVDICQRNKIPELKWQGNPSLIGQVSVQNMTVHRWFASKACPGDYLYNKHGEIAEKVNARLSGETAAPDGDYESFIWNYFSGKIGNDYGVAGLMGNLYHESGLKPNNLQNSFESVLGHTDTTYTEAVDAGTYSENSFVNDSAGYGLAQWTFYTRKQGLYTMYKTGGYSSIGSIELACNYLWKELQSDYSGVLETLKTSTSVRTASDKVLHDFESPADQSTSVEEKRHETSVYFYNKYSGNNDGTGGNGSGEEGSSGNHNTDFEGIMHRKRLSLLLMAVGTDQ